MVIYHGRIRKKITLNKSKFPLLSLHVLVTLPKEKTKWQWDHDRPGWPANLHQQKNRGKWVSPNTC